ncbi:MAG: AAA-like domain-containing protein, partial [Acidobacteriota bacterium]|nr:AAA-like domain-containing protein [Acidobacteriota bacterium]
AALPSWGDEAAKPAAGTPASSGALAAGAPLPAADPAITMDTGTMRLDSPFYIERAEDRLLAGGLEHRGVTFRVKGVRQCGKSSLVARAYALARRAGRRAAYVDFQSLDEEHFASLRTLLQALAWRISRALGIRSSPDRFWQDGGGDKNSFAAFLEDTLLAGADSPVILCFDEVDRVFGRPYRDDFFSGLRYCHNQRAIEPAWEWLNLVIAHATEPSLWIQHPEQSPFNVGERLDLDDFSAGQVAELGQRYRRPLAATPDLERLMDLLGGHPYLVRQALYMLSTHGWALADLERVACDDGGPFGDHLRRQLWALRQEPRLRPAVQEILRRGACSDEDAYQRLRTAGLVRGEHRAALHLRCRLYRDYLTRHL